MRENVRIYKGGKHGWRNGDGVYKPDYGKPENQAHGSKLHEPNFTKESSQLLRENDFKFRRKGAGPVPPGLRAVQAHWTESRWGSLEQRLAQLYQLDDVVKDFTYFSIVGDDSD